MSTLNHFGKLVALLVILSVSGFHNPRLCLHSRDCPHQVLFSADSDYEEEALPSKKRRGPARVRPIRPTASTEKVQARRVEAQARHNEALKDPTLLSIVKFAERTDIHPATKRAITEVMGLQSMTQIQAKTYAAALAGDSVLGRARTGTGKTLAYLLPALERLLGSDLELYRPGRNIGILIVAPTRELAIQIADQAKYLLSFHNDMDVACIYGGTKIQRDTRILSGKTMPTILVATPGRLLDHLEETRIERRKFSDIIAETRIVVLDEADRLFEGFSKETTSILSFLPRAEKRQTLLFSATVPNKLRGFLKGSMKIDFTEVDCVNDGEVQSETNARVEQTFFVLENMEQYIPILVELLREAMKEDNHKVVVFFPATKIVRFFADFFNVGLKIPVLELHSRMSQSSRNRASSSFREAKRGVLFTSDVSARGVDYPDVTLVVQYGAPSTDDGYIHRLGRTGRAGRQGKGLLVLLPFEEGRAFSMRRRGIEPDTYVAELSDAAGSEEIQQLLEPIRLRIRSRHSTLTPSAQAAYKAFLAYYVAKSCGLEPAEILEHAKVFAYSMGLAELPPLEAKIASRLKLEGLVG